MMTTSTTMTQPRPSPYLHQLHHQDYSNGGVGGGVGGGGSDSRATSPTVVVATNLGKQQDVVMSPVAVTTTASSNSPTSSPVSTGYQYHPNQAHHQYSSGPPSAQQQQQQQLQYPSSVQHVHVSFNTTDNTCDNRSSHSHSNHGSSGNLQRSGSSHYHQSYSVEHDPLSPQSAPVVPSAAWPTFPPPPPTTTTSSSIDHHPGSANGTPVPVPKEIHTSNNYKNGPPPYFPSIKSSGSLCSKASSVTANSSSKAITVTGKKKHLTKAVSVSSISSSHGGEFTTTTMVDGKKGEPVPARRQKRLERNRESARLSRRRRKQYLEVLEERVAKLSLDVDRGRREHSCMAIDVVMSKRHQVLQIALAEIENSPQGGGGGIGGGHSSSSSSPSLERSVWLLDGPLSRTSEEFLILSTFFTEQLKSFALPSHSKFVLWLTLQGDTYFRGGRAASERLSAARIGERVSSPVSQ
jgi:hypothetical protein